MNKERLIADYEIHSPLIASCGENCKRVLKELLDDSKIAIHDIHSRVKTLESFSRKIDSKLEKYTDIHQITDVFGIRVITFLDSDVDKVAEIIKKEFHVDEENTVDKRALKADQFGYRSLHFIVSLSPDRLKLSENIKYKDIKIEIQIRSILQHAWAEIEHDLGYKREIAIPEEFKRSFNRLSALLETADIEFDRLKRDLQKYEENLPLSMKNNANEVMIDQTSVALFVHENKIFRDARQIMQQNTQCTFYQVQDLSFELEKLEFFGITTIGQLGDLLEEHKEEYLLFVNELIKDTTTMRGQELRFSLPLFYFCHFLAVRNENNIYLDQYLKYGQFPISEAAGMDMANAYLRIKK